MTFRRSKIGGGALGAAAEASPWGYRVSIEISLNATRDPEYDCRPICP